MKAQPKPKRERDEAYLKWIRTQPCCVCPTFTDGNPWKTEPHHVRPKGGGIMGSKVSDYRTVPLCRFHHEEAQSHPDLYRKYFEASIGWHRMQYRPPKPKKERTKILIEKCICGKRHVLYSCPVEAK